MNHVKWTVPTKVLSNCKDREDVPKAGLPLDRNPLRYEPGVFVEESHGVRERLIRPQV
jgi:hypothetical protein